MCRFEYTDRCRKLISIYDYAYVVYAILLMLIVVNQWFLKIVHPMTAFNIMSWAIVVMSLIGGLLDLYKIRCISIPVLNFTLQYTEINHDDPLQKSIIAQAIEYSTSWAEFALKREKSTIQYGGIAKIVFAVILALLLII